MREDLLSPCTVNQIYQSLDRNKDENKKNKDKKKKD